jgi:hypothetical protein
MFRRTDLRYLIAILDCPAAGWWALANMMSGSRCAVVNASNTAPLIGGGRSMSAPRNRCSLNGAAKVDSERRAASVQSDRMRRSYRRALGSDHGAIVSSGA